jgi:hypothetical protein
MLKKIFGIILIMISIFLGFVFIAGIPENITLILVSVKGNSEYSFGYAMGNTLVWILLFRFFNRFIQIRFEMVQEKH